MNLSNHLRDKEQLFRLIVESIPGFVCSMTPAGVSRHNSTGRDQALFS